MPLSPAEKSKQNPRLAALRILAARRLTEAQLWGRLERRGYDGAEIRATVAWCRVEGYLDDGLFARLFVEGRTKAVGDARLVAELVRRGVDRDAAARSVALAECDEGQRLERALARLFRINPGLGYPQAARALERLGFPAPAIYRRLRAHAGRFGAAQAEAEDCHVLAP